MIYLKKYEDFNVQDMMSYPTKLPKTREISKEPNVQDMMTIKTNITNGNEYVEDPNNDFTIILQPYYDFIKTLTGIKDLSQITYEKLDDYVGFSFVAYYIKVMILSDKENVHILINNDLIPLENPEEILKILESET